MAYLEYRNLIKRVDFSKMGKVVEIPNLIKAQQESYEDFLQMNVPHEKRRDIGLQSVFKSISSSSPARSDSRNGTRRSATREE